MVTITINKAAELVASIKHEIRKVLVGQDASLDLILTSLIASGHVLIEGLPGLGKTLLVRALAASIGGTTNRVQFTPDLMPSDLLGVNVLNMATGTFTTRRGPVFTHLLLADEINRAPAKTQSALLESMQEYQVSLDGETMQLERPYLVLATQNPFEHEGTYPLPEAQLDRFLVKLLMVYPNATDEAQMARAILSDSRGDTLDISSIKPVTDTQTLKAIQDSVSSVIVDDSVIDYVVAIIAKTRSSHGIIRGAGPRATLALLRLARAHALTLGRDFVTPDDIKELAAPVLRHRISIDPAWEMEGATTDDAVSRLLSETEAPRT